MIDLLKNLIEDYLNSLPEPEEMDKIEKVSALRHNIGNITEIELDEHLIKFIYEKDDVTAVQVQLRAFSPQLVTRIYLR